MSGQNPSIPEFIPIRTPEQAKEIQAWFNSLPEPTPEEREELSRQLHQAIEETSWRQGEKEVGKD